MKMLRTVSLAIAFVALMSGVALAQTHAGLTLDAVTPAGMTLVDTDVSRQPESPLRLYFASSAQARPDLLIDVMVAASPDRARAAAQWTRETIAGHIDARSNIGDLAWGDATMLFFARHNVMIVLRSLSGAHDLTAIADAIDRAILDAPEGSPVGDPVRLRVPDLQVGDTRPLVIEGDPLASHVYGEGAVTVRRTRTGWVATRTGPGDVRIEVVAFDRRLRRAH